MVKPQKPHTHKSHRSQKPQSQAGKQKELKTKNKKIALLKKNVKADRTRKSAEHCKGAGAPVILLNCCRAHWVMVLCTHACRMLAACMPHACLCICCCMIWKETENSKISACMQCELLKLLQNQNLLIRSYWNLLDPFGALTSFDLYIQGCWR